MQADVARRARGPAVRRGSPRLSASCRIVAGKPGTTRADRRRTARMRGGGSCASATGAAAARSTTPAGAMGRGPEHSTPASCPPTYASRARIVCCRIPRRARTQALLDLATMTRARRRAWSGARASPAARAESRRGAARRSTTCASASPPAPARNRCRAVQPVAVRPQHRRVAGRAEQVAADVRQRRGIDRRAARAAWARSRSGRPASTAARAAPLAVAPCGTRTNSGTRSLSAQPASVGADADRVRQLRGRAESRRRDRRTRRAGCRRAARRARAPPGTPRAPDRRSASCAGSCRTSVPSSAPSFSTLCAPEKPSNGWCSDSVISHAANGRGSRLEARHHLLEEVVIVQAPSRSARSAESRARTGCAGSRTTGASPAGSRIPARTARPTASCSRAPASTRGRPT